MIVEEVKKFFISEIAGNKDESVAVIAIRTLMEIIKDFKSETLQELDETLKEAISVMKTSNHPVASINSGCELFIRFITLARLDTNSFAECKKIMLNRGNIFLANLSQARNKIVCLSTTFVKDGSKILTHSRSRVVLKTLIHAARQNKRFDVFVTLSAPDNSGLIMCKELQDAGIQSTIILDSAIGFVLEEIDFVMVGAEAVVESGGIVNKIGSYTLAMCAKELKKPFYVLTESFKFSRLFPLNQHDLPDDYKYLKTCKDIDSSKQHALVDYTPPAYITLLFTDLGILTPSAVSDELIKLYL